MTSPVDASASVFLRNGVTIHLGDCRGILASLEPESVHCCVTSPPYWGLRDYGHEAQLGLEATPEEYVSKMVEVFRGVRRALRPDATLWLNLGDTIVDKQLQGIPWRIAFALQADGWYLRSEIIWHKPNPMPESVNDRPTKSHEQIFLLAKAPRYYYDAEAIKEDSVDPESINGRRPRHTRKDHEHKVTPGSHDQEFAGNRSGFLKGKSNDPGRTYLTRNRRSVWTIPTKPYSGAHFAVFPPALIEPCILAGTSEEGCCPACGAPWERVVERTPYRPETVAVGDRFVDESRQDKTRKLSGKEYNDQVSSRTTGWRPTCDCDAGDPIPCTVLDPFLGSGTTADVAIKNGCRCIGCELSPEYFELAKDRFEQRRLF